MDRAFPVILSELRKERGLSQKEAAARLGISQALLSHYEKGIRECGQSFLIRVADFYGVTCDYLLGRTTERNDVDAFSTAFISSTITDKNPSGKTFIKAGQIISQAIREGEKGNGMRLDMLYALEIYKVILMQANAGNLPKNWCGRAYIDGNVCCNSLYLGIIDLAASSSITPPKSKNPEVNSPVPDAVKTLVTEAENFICRVSAEQCPPVPFEFLK